MYDEVRAKKTASSTRYIQCFKYLIRMALENDLLDDIVTLPVR
jgi:hypothetical protein